MTGTVKFNFKKKEFMKKSILFSVFIFIVSFTYAQWQPTNGLFSGEVHSVITSNNEIIVGTKYIYKSTDNGRTWFVSNNGISGSVTKINTLTKISTCLVAGTDAGVFYSTDNGNNWAISAGTSSIGVFCMVVKGTNLFMSTVGNGVYKSTTNGITWSAVNGGITNITWMRAIAVKGNDLYAATDGYGIYKSINDGAHWDTVNTGLPGHYYSVSALAVDHDTILAGTYGAGIYRLAGSSTTWRAVNNGVSSSDEILAMGVNGSSVYASTINGNLYKTTDCNNWVAVSPGNITATRFEAFYSATGIFYAGSWGFGSPEQSYGLFKTTDDGATWKHIGITDYPVSVLEVSGNNIIAGTNDISGNSARIPLFKTTESDSVWSFNLGGFAGKNITALKANGALMYLFDDEGPGNSLVYRSVNNGINWTSTGFNALYFNFVSFVIAGTTIYAGDNSSYYSSSHVFVSTDQGASWSVVNGGIPSTVHTVYALVLNGNAVFAATDNGIYKNTVGQNSWTAVNSGLTNMIIKSLCVSGTYMYAGTQGGGIFRSDYNGSLWTEVNNGIPLFTDVNCFATKGTNAVFAGSGNGVFVSSNNGNSWASVNTGLIDTTITCLLASTNYLWAGTYSQGVWRRQLSQIIGGTPATPGNITGSTSVCPGSTNTYSVVPVSGATSYTWTLPSGWSGASTMNSINATAGSGGIISVTANNSFGSSPPRTLNVTVTYVNTSVTQSGMTLTADAGGAAYVWINCNGNTPVPGQTYQSFTAGIAGNYAVIVTQSGCSDTSTCYTADTICHITMSGADLPYSGLNALLYIDTTTNVSLGSPGVSRSWNYSPLTPDYMKVAIYNSTSVSGYASVFPTSNIYSYGPGLMFGSLFGGAPVGSGNNGYVFWKSDNTGLWVTGFRPDGGLCAGINVQDNPQELLIGVPASYGSVFNNSARWQLPMNRNASNPDTFYVRIINKIITADACGSLTTPYNVYPNILREHEYVIAVDSIYLKTGGTVISSIEFRRDTLNNYMYLSGGIGYPVCIVHADKHNTVIDVEYYAGVPFGINDNTVTEKRLLLYPNPSDGNIMVEFPVENNKGDKQIFIYNSLGCMIWQKRTSEDGANINITGFPKGVYFIKITNNQKIMTEKIILQ